MNANKPTSTLRRILSQRSKDEVVLHTWQFELARRMAQVLEEKGMTQSELAKKAGLSNAQVSAILHSNANPTLATLAKIEGLLDTQILMFANADEHVNEIKSCQPQK